MCQIDLDNINVSQRSRRPLNWTAKCSGHDFFGSNLNLSMLQRSNVLKTCLNRFSISKYPTFGPKIIKIGRLWTNLALYKLSGEFQGERLRDPKKRKVPKNFRL